MPHPELNFSRIAYICLYCSNVDDSIRFYRDVLGLKVLSQSPEFTCFDTGATKLAIEPGGVRKNGKKELSENPVLLQIAAHSAEELAAMDRHLETHGVKLLTRSKSTPYGIITNFVDPDGNKLEIICPST